MTMGLTSPTSTTGQILKNGSAVISFDANNNATFAGNVAPTVNPTFRNRIINGAMVIDQRNAGAAVSLIAGTPNTLYTIDRWAITKGTAGGFTGQRSTLAPPGFTNSIQFTVTNAVTPASTDFFGARQNIEGLNVADLGWGTANAQTVTLSFWIRCSVTGTYNWSLMNSAETRGYVASFTVNSANTWEYKTLTISGDTSGTWLTTNGVGVSVYLDLGTGSTYSTTAGSWQTFNFAYGLTGGTKFISNAGATMNITGVQLEAGSVATPFEQRLYGTELALCQRYYWRNAPGGGSIAVSSGVMYGSTLSLSYTQFPVAMRANPTGSVSAASDFTAVGGASTITPSAIVFLSSTLSSRVEATLAGATSGQGMIMQSNNSSSWMAFAAEL